MIGIQRIVRPVSVYQLGLELTYLVENGVVSNHENCFLCGEPVRGEFLYWQGCTGSIALHESCGNYLGWNLVKDSAILRISKVSQLN